MVARMIDKLSGRWALSAMLVWLAIYGYLNFIPASWWMNVESVMVPPVVSAQKSVPIVVQRTIKQDFTGQWVVNVRKLQGTDWINYCAGAGESNYSKDLPSSLSVDLEWWSGHGCKTLSPGTYRIVTSWRINPKYNVERWLSIDSNVFNVEP